MTDKIKLLEERSILIKARDEAKIISNIDKYNECKLKLKDVAKKIKSQRDKTYIYKRIHCDICNEDVLKYNVKFHEATKKHQNKRIEKENM